MGCPSYIALAGLFVPALTPPFFRPSIGTCSDVDSADGVSTLSSGLISLDGDEVFETTSAGVDDDDSDFVDVDFAGCFCFRGSSDVVTKPSSFVGSSLRMTTLDDFDFEPRWACEVPLDDGVDMVCDEVIRRRRE